jgi:hypothetical protein
MSDRWRTKVENNKVLDEQSKFLHQVHQFSDTHQDYHDSNFTHAQAQETTGLSRRYALLPMHRPIRTGRLPVR